MSIRPNLSGTRSSRRPAVVRYGCAVGSVAAAFFATNGVGEENVGVAPLFFAAVALSAWFGGLGPGLLATGLAGAASAFFLFHPVYSFRIGWDDLVRVLVFSLVAVLISSLQAASRRSHARMVEANRRAVAANRAKDRFLAVLSHELRNPLNPIVTVAGVLERDRRLPGDVREDLGMIRRNAELEARLVDDLLDLNRIARGKLAMSLEVIDAHALANDVLGMVRADAEAKGVTLTARLAAEGPYLYADAGRLRQVLWNLLRNAVKFTPAGGHVTVTTAADADRSFRLDVTDTGIGIEPEALDRIFNAFEQADETTAQRFGGLGLGLAIARSLVEAHGGTLSASSAGKGHGASFTVRLPAVTAPEQTRNQTELPAARPVDLRRLPSPAAADTEDEGRLRILLVEDHAETSRVLCRLLRGTGYDVTAASTVGDALRVAADGAFDLLICDLQLPDGTGWDVVGRIDRDVKAIALSGYMSNDDWRRSHEVGFDEHLTKPVSAQTLEAAIRRVASNPRTAERLRLRFP